MITRPSPSQKKTNSTTQAQTTARQRTSAIKRIVHELINQLSVLNLVGYNIVSRNGARCAAKIARNTEMFESFVHEVTLLAEQLAHYLASQQATLTVERGRETSDEGRVVRLLRSVPHIRR